jgi:hypothetical protein
MTDVPLLDLERELVRAAARGAHRRRRPSPRTLLLAAALAVLLVVPAWAAGLLDGVFPATHDSLPGVGRAYVVAAGTTERGERWRFEITRGTRFRDGKKSSPCAVFAVGVKQGFLQCAGGGPSHGFDGGFGTLASVSRKDRRRLLVAAVPLRVASVALRFSSGRELRVRPLAVDQAKARRTGVPFRGGFVAVAYEAGQRVTGLVLLDARGRPLRNPAMGRPFRPSQAARLVQSPVV